MHECCNGKAYISTLWHEARLSVFDLLILNLCFSSIITAALYSTYIVCLLIVEGSPKFCDLAELGLFLDYM